MKNKIIFLATTLTIVLYYINFSKYIVNIPVNDDYRAIIGFLNDFLQANSVNKFQLLFSQANEHRLFFDRIITLVDYYIYDNINFIHLAWVGNLALLFIFIFIKRKIIDANHLPKELLLVVSITLFTFSFWENMTFAMSALSNFYSLLFALISIYYFINNQEKWSYLIAYLCLFLSIYTQGGGVFIIPIVFCFLYLKKRTKDLGLFTGFAVIILCFYFIGYHQPTHHVSVFENIKNYPFKSIIYFFTFLGNDFNYYLIFNDKLNQSLIFCGIIGGIKILGFLYLTKKKLYEKNPFIYSILCLILLISAVTAVSRVYSGIETSAASRYRLNGTLYTIFLIFGLYIVNLKSTLVKLNVTFVTLSIAFFIFISLPHIEFLYYRKYSNLLGALRYNETGKIDLLNTLENERLYDGQAIKVSENLNFYSFKDIEGLGSFFPESYLVDKLNLEESNQLKETKDNMLISEIHDMKDSYLIEGFGFLDGINVDNQKVYIVLQNTDNSSIKIFSSKKTKRFDLNPYFKKSGLTNAGFVANVPKHFLEKMVNYKVITLLEDESSKKLKFSESDKYLNID